MRFLAFEGIDGAGKSTLIQGLKSELEKQSISYVITREPGGTPLGDDIRQLLLRTDGDAPVPRAEALLYQAGRAQHVEKLIKPSLAQNKWVLSDRFAASSIAFQAAGRDLRVEQVVWLNQFSTGGLNPDLYVLLDITVEESMRRLQQRGQEADRFELEKQEFFERVRTAYIHVAKGSPKTWLLLDARQPAEVLLHTLVQELRLRKWLS